MPAAPRSDAPRSDTPPVVVIANPAAGRGRGARLIPRLRTIVESAVARSGGTLAVELRLTTHAGEEFDLAREAAEQGVATIAALGGDGTWGNVVRGIMAARVMGERPRLALLAAGTGNDLAWATGIPAHDLEGAIEIAMGVGERRIDVGEADGVHFVNCLGFGFDAAVLEGTQRVRWLRGHAVYLFTAARMLLGYPGIVADVRVGGATTPGKHYLAVIFANGPRFGGGFRIAPGARLDDGALDLVCVADAPALRRAVVFAGVTRGTHTRSPEVDIRSVREATLTFDSPPIFDADGELHRARGCTVTVRCHRQALRLAVPS
ncbi:MAG: diacylglycerol kinase family lipid kinase [Gemmatimonadaceae bacterium]|nr:diacylglycerol kinase family lipid kinase [Gemmatimonadaceae bacterium]